MKNYKSLFAKSFDSGSNFKFMKGYEGLSCKCASSHYFGSLVAF